MARNSQKEVTQQPQEQCPMPSPQPNPSPVSLQGPLADVPEQGPTEEIVIGQVDAKPTPEPAPTPVVETDEDGSITIR